MILSCRLLLAIAGAVVLFVPGAAAVVGDQTDPVRDAALPCELVSTQGGVSRVAYTEADRQGREYVLGLMRAAKLDTSIDAAGETVSAIISNGIVPAAAHRLPHEGRGAL